MLNLSLSLKRSSAALFVLLGGSICLAQNYTLTNLTSDGFITANNTDANLVNPWGLSRSSGSPWWISDNGTGLTTLYDGTGAAQSLVVTIPAAQAGQTGTPSGTIYNPTTAFPITPGHPAAFLFATEDGTVAGWNGGSTAVTLIKKTNAVYKGLTAATWNGQEVLYVANFRSGHIEAYDQNLQPIQLPGYAFKPTWEGLERFFEHTRGIDFFSLSPYNIQNIGGTLFVTFAQPDAARHDNVGGAGLGLVASFTPAGQLIHIYQPGPFLNGPWAIAMAPSDFGAYSHCLLIGNFSSGEIVAYNVESGMYIGKLLDPSGNTIVIDGLWGLSFGNGGRAGNLNTLYVTSGPSDESHGLFQSLVPVASTQPGNDL